MGEGLIVRRGAKDPEPLAIEAGLIVEFFGSALTIPEGWALCDGINGTPDLRNRFIIGAGDTYSNGDTGGFTDATLVSHNHSGNSDTATHSHTFDQAFFAGSLAAKHVATILRSPTPSILSSASGSHSHTWTASTTGTSATNTNLPPYFGLLFIIKEEN